MELDGIYLPTGLLLSSMPDYFSSGSSSSFSGIDRGRGLDAGSIVRLPLVIPDDFPLNLQIGDIVIWVSGSSLPVVIPGLPTLHRLELGGIIYVDRRNK